jgi:hypothetical protein
MNGDDSTESFTPERKGETSVIIIVTVTLCALGIWCVTIQGLCVLWKIPDMNTTLSNAFMHVTDTIIGAVIGWTAKSGAQKMLKKDEPQKTEIVNTTANPAKVETV